MSAETIETLEQRLISLEREMTQVKKQLDDNQSQTAIHPWDKVFGSFADSDGFEEAVRLGREYRESQRQQDDEAAA